MVEKVHTASDADGYCECPGCEEPVGEASLQNTHNPKSRILGGNGSLWLYATVTCECGTTFEIGGPAGYTGDS
jgi:hypothetical protein